MRHIKKKKLKKIFFFIFLYFFIDILLTQLFLDNFYHQKREKIRASIVENRILNSDYKYTFPRKKSFKSFDFRRNSQENIKKTENIFWESFGCRGAFRRGRQLINCCSSLSSWLGCSGINFVANERERFLLL